MLTMSNFAEDQRKIDIGSKLLTVSPILCYAYGSIERGEKYADPTSGILGFFD